MVEAVEVVYFFVSVRNEGHQVLTRIRFYPGESESVFIFETRCRSTTFVWTEIIN